MAVTDGLGTTPSPGFERQPPQDIAAEQSVLGGMLLSKDAIADVVEVLRSGDFYRPAHQVIYDTVLDLYGRGEPADPITIAAELTRSGQLARVGGSPYLHTLVSLVPTAANAGYYAEIVSERAILRRLVEAGTRIVQLGYGAASGQGGEVDEVVDRAQAEIYDVTERRTSEDYVRLEQLLQGTMDEIDAIASRGGAGVGVPTGFAELDERTHGLHPGQMVVIAARPAVGKALALDTPLPTPTGWTTMGDARVGDQLIGADGRPATIVAATEVMYGRPCYEVEFSDGTVIVADGQHQWTTRVVCRTHGERRPPRHCWASTGTCRGASVAAVSADRPERVVTIRGVIGEAVPGPGAASPGELRLARGRVVAAPPGEVGRPLREWCAAEHAPVVTTEEIAATLGRPSGVHRRWHAVAVAAPMQLPERDLPLAPYVLGAWLGTGHTGSAGGSVQALRSMGILGDKHIPVAYLRASESQRRALLTGLLDTTGTVRKSDGSVQLAVTGGRLAQDVLELAISLGHRATMRTKAARVRSAAPSTRYTVDFTPAEGALRPPGTAAHPTSGKSTKVRYITAVRRVANVPVRCVQVDSADHLYLASRSMIPTHNSTLALDVARSCSIKHRLASVIFSLEMSKSEITMRLLSAEAKVPLHHMRSGHMSDDDWARLARRMGEVADAPLYVDDSPNLTMMEIRAKARRLKQREDLRLVVVDYLQLMTSGKRVESRQQEVSEFSRSLKLLAKELEVPVIAISQLNRSPEQRQDKKPMLADLRESGAIEQDSDLVILLHREDIYERESPRAGEADLILAKHRNGPTGTVTVAFQGHYSRFVDMAT
jgi:replicative DNA helicase